MVDYNKRDIGGDKMEPKDITISDKSIITVFEQIKADIFQTRGKVLSDANKELLFMDSIGVFLYTT